MTDPASDLRALIASEIYRAVNRLTDDPELLSILGSYGDTLEDEEILSLLQDFNTSGRIMHARH